MSALDTMIKSYVTVEADGKAGGSIVAHGPRASFILTCDHVVKGTKNPKILIRDGNRFRFMLTSVVATDEDNDLALLKTRRRMKESAVELASDGPELYEDAFILGSHDGLHGTAGRCVVCGLSGSNGSRDSRNQIQFTGPVAAGMSGGMLGDVDGALIGVPSHGARSGEHMLGNIGFAVPLSIVKEFLKKHLPK
jgi:S1-C subfamily serine protease